MEICGVYLILHFARSSANRIDTYDYIFYAYFGCQCSIVEKSPREGSKMGGYPLDLYK